jgi:hypothetical protein
LREKGLLTKLLEELNIKKAIKFHRCNPSDIIVTPLFEIKIFNEIEKTILEFQKCFPTSKKEIASFFHYIIGAETFFDLRNKTFNIVLEFYFREVELRNLFSVWTASIIGIDAQKLSAVIGCLLIREFFLDGGYYPQGGMQVLPDVLVKKFKAMGGGAFIG